MQPSGEATAAVLPLIYCHKPQCHLQRAAPETVGLGCNNLSSAQAVMMGKISTGLLDACTGWVMEANLCWHLGSDQCCLEYSGRCVRHRPLQPTTQQQPPPMMKYMSRRPTPGRL